MLYVGLISAESLGIEVSSVNAPSESKPNRLVTVRVSQINFVRLKGMDPRAQHSLSFDNWRSNIQFFKPIFNDIKLSVGGNTFLINASKSGVGLGFKHQEFIAITIIIPSWKGKTILKTLNGEDFLGRGEIDELRLFIRI